MKISRHRRNRYMVSVYLADDVAKCPISDRLSIPLIRLFGGTVLAENDRMAAARVWFDQVDNGVEAWLISIREDL